MERIKITVKDEWGTPVNEHSYNSEVEHSRSIGQWNAYDDFINNHPPLPAPGIKDTIEPVMAEVQCQGYHRSSALWSSITEETYSRWLREHEPKIIWNVRQIYILSPEVKKSVDKGIGEEDPIGFIENIQAEIFETNLSLGYNELAYLVHYRNNDYLCIGIKSERFTDSYAVGELAKFQDHEINLFEKSAFKLSESTLWNDSFIAWLISRIF